MRLLGLLASQIIVLALLAAATPAGGGSVSTRPYVYEGKTNQCPLRNGRCGRAVVKLRYDFTRLEALKVSHRANCEKGAPILDTTRSDNVFLRQLRDPAGVRFREQGNAKEIDMTKGRTGRATTDFSGSLYATGNGFGVLRTRITVLDANRNEIDRCSASITFRVALTAESRR